MSRLINYTLLRLVYIICECVCVFVCYSSRIWNSSDILLRLGRFAADNDDDNEIIYTYFVHRTELRPSGNTLYIIRDGHVVPETVINNTTGYPTHLRPFCLHLSSTVWRVRVARTNPTNLETHLGFAPLSADVSPTIWPPTKHLKRLTGRARPKSIRWPNSPGQSDRKGPSLRESVVFCHRRLECPSGPFPTIAEQAKR